MIVACLGQTYMIFLAKLKKPDFSPGPESSECQLFPLDDLPFNSLSFSSMVVTLSLVWFRCMNILALGFIMLPTRTVSYVVSHDYSMLRILRLENPNSTMELLWKGISSSGYFPVVFIVWLEGRKILFFFWKKEFI